MRKVRISSGAAAYEDRPAATAARSRNATAELAFPERPARRILGEATKTRHSLSFLSTPSSRTRH